MYSKVAHILLFCRIGANTWTLLLGLEGILLLSHGVFNVLSPDGARWRGLSHPIEGFPRINDSPGTDEGQTDVDHCLKKVPDTFSERLIAF